MKRVKAGMIDDANRKYPAKDDYQGRDRGVEKFLPSVAAPAKKHLQRDRDASSTYPGDDGSTRRA
jgi:hypothetical protein